MSGFTSGFKEFQQKIDDIKILAPLAIDISLEETGIECAKLASDLSPKDTGTLKESWEIREDNKRTGGYVDSTHSVTIWSNPEIISFHPKHPDGEYYPPLIENGFTKPNGKYYRGKHMLKKAFSLCKKNLKASLKKNLGDVFSR